MEYNIEGIWLGKLRAQSIELRIVFKVKSPKQGEYQATMDSPDQGAMDIPVEEVKVYENTLVINMPVVNGKYNGSIEPDGKTINGTWTQSGIAYSLDLKKTDKPIELNRPQEPKKPYPYDEEEVVFANNKDNIKIAGTLTLPRVNQVVPAVILLSGSGPQNRDGEVFQHRYFLVLADYLTRQGIAVLRCDDRGVGKSAGSIYTSVTDDFANDVLAAVEVLKKHNRIDKNKIGLIGHSEGGVVAMTAAVNSRDITFIVLMAAPAIPGEELLYLQAEMISRAAMVDEAAIAANRRRQERMFAVLKSDLQVEEAAARLREILENDFRDLSEEQRIKQGYSKQAIDSTIKQVITPWFRYFLTFDPRVDLEKLKCAVLAINGDKDLQVPAKINLQAIEQALKRSGNKNYMIKQFKGHNHMLQQAQIGLPTEYAMIEQTISPEVLKTISDWISSTVKENHNGNK